jgi:hypothetical protein
MNGLEQLRYTHPGLIEESIAAFDRIIAAHAKVGRELEAIQARAHARLDALQPATPVNQTDEE